MLSCHVCEWVSEWVSEFDCRNLMQWHFHLWLFRWVSILCRYETCPPRVTQFNLISWFLPLFRIVCRNFLSEACRCLWRNMCVYCCGVSAAVFSLQNVIILHIYYTVSVLQGKLFSQERGVNWVLSCVGREMSLLCSPWFKWFVASHQYRAHVTYHKF